MGSSGPALLNRHAALAPLALAALAALAACNAILGNERGREELGTSSSSGGLPEGGVTSSSSGGSSSGAAPVEDAASDASADVEVDASCNTLCGCTPTCKRLPVQLASITHLAASDNRIFVHADEIRRLTTSQDGNVSVSDPYLIGNVVVAEMAARLEEAEAPLFVLSEQDTIRTLWRCPEPTSCSALDFDGVSTMASAPHAIALQLRTPMTVGGTIALLTNAGAMMSLQSIDRAARRLAASETVFFVPSDQKFFRSELNGLELTTPQAFTFDTVPGPDPQAATANASSLFLSHVSCGAAVCKLPAAGPVGSVLISPVEVPGSLPIQHLFADGVYLYWSTAEETRRCKITSCATSPELLLDRGAVGFTRNAQQVFFAAGSDIFSLEYHP